MAERKTASKPLPSQEYLNSRLRYDPDTGKLFWKPKTVDMFAEGRHTAAHTCNRWNSRFAGKEAFTSKNGAGYLHSSIDGQPMLAHRVIFKMMTGKDADFIDHDGGVRDNNRWSKLNDVSQSGNLKNSARHKDNMSGATGVRWSPSCSKWQAFIGVDYQQICLGTFDSFDDAVATRKAAEQKHNFHRNHGRSAAI